MRKLTSGNKMNFVIFAMIIVVILVILICGLIRMIRTEKERYEIPSSSSIYDKDYNYIKLEEEGTLKKKWTGNYYLKENITKKEYNIGKYAVVYNKNQKMVDLFGTFYQVLKGGDISKTTEHSNTSSQKEDKFYKIDDRKYLIVAQNIENDTGSIKTQGYLMIIIDKIGNALLLNNEINVNTINQMIINTNDFSFDVANELLKYEKDNIINLKKIIGSTNEYVKVEENIKEEENKEEPKEETNNEDKNEVINANSIYTSPNTNRYNNNQATIIKNPTQVNAPAATAKDSGWVDKLNEWMGDVADGFKSIYNGNSNKKEEKELSKSVTLNNLVAGITYIDINYTVIDPENKYNIVYVNISDGTNIKTISLDKSATTYRVTGLRPKTNYIVEIGYKEIYKDSSVKEEIEDIMTVKTKAPVENLEISKVTTSRIYYVLKLDSEFVYDIGAKIVVYINDTTKYIEKELTSENLERAASSGYEGIIDIPDEYRNKNSSLKIRLENTKYNGEAVNQNLVAKIVNY